MISKMHNIYILYCWC